MPSNTWAEICLALLSYKICIFFFSSWFLQGVSPMALNHSNHKGTVRCNQHTPWLTSKPSLSWDCIFLRPLFLSQPSLWENIWGAAMSWSERCSRWCDIAKLLTQGSQADGTFWFCAKIFPPLARSSVFLAILLSSEKRQKSHFHENAMKQMS